VKLTAVSYELFEADLDGLDSALGQNSHGIDREIKLLFDNVSTIYISWCSQPDHYAVGYQNNSWFIPPPPATLDATNWPLWQPLIGQTISLNYLDEQHQVLEIKSTAGAVYCSSFDGNYWAMDVLYISSAIPPSYSKVVATAD
jgi:hypothetical protein